MTTVALSMWGRMGSMCNGNLLSEEMAQWLSFSEAAQDAFSKVPTRSGVYVLRVKKVGVSNLAQVKDTFIKSPFMKAAALLDAESGSLFASVGLGDTGAWTYANHCERRLGRLGLIAMRREGLACPIIYVGRANDLARRMRELAFGGHTANAPFWALLLSGWEVDLGFRPTRKKAEVAEEARLKQVFRSLHGESLPPLVER